MEILVEHLLLLNTAERGLELLIVKSDFLMLQKMEQISFGMIEQEKKKGEKVDI